MNKGFPFIRFVLPNGGSPIAPTSITTPLNPGDTLVCESGFYGFAKFVNMHMVNFARRLDKKGGVWVLLVVPEYSDGDLPGVHVAKRGVVKSTGHLHDVVPFNFHGRALLRKKPNEVNWRFRN